MIDDKLRSFSILLWEREKEIQELKRQILEKDKIIFDLKTEIEFSDMEVKDLTDIVNNSRSVECISKLCNKLEKLSSENKEFSEIFNNIISENNYEYTM